MSIQAYFPTHVYYESLQRDKAAERKFHAQLLKEIAEVRQMDKAGIAWSKENYRNGFTSYASANDLHRRTPTFAELERRIDAHVKKFAAFLDFDLNEKLAMTTCWVNVMPKNTHHGMHIHPLSVLSGTYYVTVPGDASAIKFEDPRLDRMMAAPPKRARANRRNQLFASIAPEAGKLVLFESWLRHEVPMNKSSVPRISISFNYA